MPAKRRTTKRQQSAGVLGKPIEKKVKEKAPVKSFNAEFLIFLKTVAIIFLTCSIVSEKALEEGQVTTNLMGPIGDFTGKLLRGAFGWSSLIFVGWILSSIMMSVYKIKDKKKKDNAPKYKMEIRVGAFILSILCFSCFIALMFGEAGGGTIGNNIANLLKDYTGILGTLILSFSFFVILTGFALSYTISDISKISASSIAVGGKYVFLVFPYYVYASFMFVIKKAFMPFKNYMGFLYDEEDNGDEAQEEEEYVLPKPKRRNNRSTAKEDEEDLGDYEIEGEEEEEEEEPYEILVKRGNGKANSEKSLKEADKAIKNAQRESMFWCDDEKYKNFDPPSLSLLKKSSQDVASLDSNDELLEKSRIIEKKLKEFGIVGRIKEVHLGPVITLFEFEPAPGVKSSKIVGLQGDIAMWLKASSVRVIAPIPKRGTVGIEVPNKNRDIVRLRDVLESEEFVNAKSILTVPIGKDIYGDAVVADIASMPHLLIAGATGTGKSVFINTLLISLLYRSNPAELGLILIDPKILELSVYEGIPHLRVPVVTKPKQAQAVLMWAIGEMDRRYRLLQKYGVRNIDGYNAIVRGEVKLETSFKSFRKNEYIELEEEDIVEEGTIDDENVELDLDDDPTSRGEKLKPLAKIIIVIDEFADLIFTVGRDIEEAITRLAQKARASGIHLILATQRPSVDVITGLIKANFPARVSFKVASNIDSRTILDTNGAEKLLGKGDMLFMEPGGGLNRRVHGAFVSDAEVIKVINSIKSQAKPNYDEQIIKLCERYDKEEGEGVEEDDEDRDELYDKAVDFVIRKGQASTSMIQRAFRIGYNRAARIIDTMERNGIIGPMDGAKPREILVGRDEIDDEEYNDDDDAM